MLNISRSRVPTFLLDPYRSLQEILTSKEIVMKSVVPYVCLIVCTANVLAQMPTPADAARERRFQEIAAKANADTSTFRGWKHSSTAGANLTEVSFKDWEAGGENALSYTLSLSGESSLIGDRTSWMNTYKFAFGQTRVAGQGMRKNDDEIYFESFLIYKVGSPINPYAALTFRSQFAAGYKYDTAGDVQVSQFFDPAYITQSAGVAYQPWAGVTTRLGVALREIITSKFPGYADDPTTPGIEKVRVRGGAESVTEAKVGVAENIELTARLELLAPFNALDKIIVRNDYILGAKVNKFVTTNLTLNLINDMNVSPRTQVKQALALGITYSLL
jgi:hypothetical protein